MRSPMAHCVGLFLASALLSVLQLQAFALLLFPVPIAWYWTQAMRGPAYGLLTCAFLSGLVIAPGLAALYLSVALSGVVLGAAAARFRRFGVCLAAMTAYLGTVTLGLLAANWPAARQSTEVFWVAQMQAVRKIMATRSEALQDSGDLMLESMQWTLNNLVNLHFGMIFTLILLFCTVAVVILRRRLAETPGALETQFSEARPPEWLVWVVIGVALCWFADQQWPQPVLRGVTWNAAVGLSAVYWLNGLSLGLYTLQALKAGWILYLLLGLFAFQARLALCIVGLFDTWWPVRDRMDRVAAVRASQNGDTSDEEP